MASAMPIEIHILASLLHAGETVQDGPEGKPIEIHEPTLLLWIDLQPTYRFAHATSMVLLSASGAKASKGSWWAIVDGKIRFPPIEGNACDVVFPLQLGEAQLHLLPDEILADDALTDGATGKPLPIHGKSVVFWLDLEPKAKFEHPTQYVVISSQGVEVVDGVERPTLHGKHHPIGVPIASPARRTLLTESQPVESGEATRVLDVQLADIARVKADPKRLTLSAVGRVPSLGWSRARLVPHVYVQAPPDGIWGFDFVAMPPSGPAGDAIGTVSAAINFTQSKGLSGVRIHAAQGDFVLRVPEIVDSEPPAGDMFSVDSCTIEGDQLVFDVSYGGGCKPHGFRLLWRGTMMPSLPPHAAFQLVHDANDDPCKAILREKLRFDLVNMPSIVMHISTAFQWEAKVHYKQPAP